MFNCLSKPRKSTFADQYNESLPLTIIFPLSGILFFISFLEGFFIVVATFRGSLHPVAIVTATATIIKAAIGALGIGNHNFIFGLIINISYCPGLINISHVLPLRGVRNGRDIYGASEVPYLAKDHHDAISLFSRDYA